MEISRIEVEDVLKNLNYPEDQIPDVTDRLLALQPDILTAFEHWMKTREFLSTPKSSDYSPASIAERYALKPPAVFLLLDWIRKDPRAAIHALTTDHVVHYILEKRG